MCIYIYIYDLITKTGYTSIAIFDTSHSPRKTSCQDGSDRQSPWVPKEYTMSSFSKYRVRPM